MSEVHISLSEFDSIRNSQKESQDRIKEAEEKFKQAAAELNVLKGKSFWKKLFS